MDRKLRNRILLYLFLAAVLAFVLIRLSGRKPAPKISAVTPVRENLISSISSNGKVEPISPYVMRAELDTFVEKVYVSEGQQVKKGQLLMELDVKDAAAQLAETHGKLLQAQDDLRVARAGGKPDQAAKVAGDLTNAQKKRGARERSRGPAGAATERPSRSARRQSATGPNHGSGKRHFVCAGQGCRFLATKNGRLCKGRRPAGGDGGPAPGARARLYR